MLRALSQHLKVMIKVEGGEKLGKYWKLTKSDKFTSVKS